MNILSLFSEEYENCETGSIWDISMSLESIIDKLKAKIKTLSDGKKNILHIMPVMLQGWGRSELTEKCRRQRQAVIAGLMATGYTPIHPECLGLATMTWPEQTLIQGTIETPYEWYQSHDDHAGEKKSTFILVVWIDERRLLKDQDGKPQPIRTLDEYISKMLPGNLSNNSENNKIIILGPATSTLFGKIIDVLKLDYNQGNKYKLKFKFISTRATAFSPDEWEKHFEDNKIKIVNTISDDSKVVSKLVQELEIRKCLPSSPFQKGLGHIAFITEWDTTYGRKFNELYYQTLASSYPFYEMYLTTLYILKIHLPKLFKMGLNILANPNTPNKNIAEFYRHIFTIDMLNKEYLKIKLNEFLWSDNIHHFRYLRGIDGTLPGDNQPETQQKPNNQKESFHNSRPKIESADMERAFGTSQLDGLRRLATKLQELQHDLEDRSQRLSAVGILGNDVYDKLLILQAVRPMLPGTIFFTTDLDARFLQFKKESWMQNLIVGSGYGLDLESMKKQGITPFRDNYQTSTFYGVYHTLRNNPIEPPEPKIYEIGIDQAHDSTNTGYIDISLTTFCISVVLILIVLMIFILPGLRMNPQIKWNADKKERASRIFFAGVFVVFTSFLGISMYISGSDPMGEPVLFFSGVSIWPTGIIRLFAASLSISLLLRATGNMRRCQDELYKEYGLSQQDTLSKLKKPSFFKWLNQEIDLFFGWTLYPGWKENIEEKKDVYLDVDDLWKKYLYLGMPWRRTIRIVIISIFLGLVFYFIRHFFELEISSSRNLARGDIAQVAHRIITSISVLSQWILAIYVIDSTILFSQIARAFSYRLTMWPQNAIRKIAQKHTGITKNLATEYLEIRFLADITRVVGRLIIYPFAVVFLMIVSRSRLFEGWCWPSGLVMIYGSLLTLLLAAAIWLRTLVEQARRSTLKELTYFRNQNSTNQSINSIDSVINLVENVQEGAFARWTQHPILRAVLYPFGGAGALYLLEYLGGLGL